MFGNRFRTYFSWFWWGSSTTNALIPCSRTWTATSSRIAGSSVSAATPPRKSAPWALVKQNVTQKLQSKLQVTTKVCTFCKRKRCFLVDFVGCNAVGEQNADVWISADAEITMNVAATMALTPPRLYTKNDPNEILKFTRHFARDQRENVFAFTILLTNVNVIFSRTTWGRRWRVWVRLFFNFGYYSRFKNIIKIV